MCRIILVRSGCTDYDEEERIQGSLELPLNEHGQDQVGEAIEQLIETSFDVVYSSPSDPANSTAKAIAEAYDVPLKEKEGLNNFNYGLWQGLKIEEIQRKFPKIYKQWQQAPETICPPSGETVSDLYERMKKVLNKPIRKKKSVLIVVSEPLATFLSCLFEKKKPVFKDFSETTSKNPRVIQFEVSAEEFGDYFQPHRDSEDAKELKPVGTVVP